MMPCRSSMEVCYILVIDSLIKVSYKFLQFGIKFADVERKKEELSAYKIDKETEISGYYQMEKQINVLKEAVKEVVTKPKYLVPFLQAGRLLHVCLFCINHDLFV